MISITVKGAKETRDRLNRAAVEYPSRIEQALRFASLVMRDKLVKRMSARAPVHPFWGKGSPAGAFLGARSGLTRLRLSPGGRVFRVGNVWTAPVGSPDRHVELHEHGGTVRGTSPRGYLRIPTAEMQTLAGVDRLIGRSARLIANAFIFRSKAGNLWIASRGRAFQSAAGREIGLSTSERRRKLTLLYLLKHSVTHRPRGIFAAVAREMNAELVRIGVGQMQAVVRTAGGA